LRFAIVSAIISAWMSFFQSMSLLGAGGKSGRLSLGSWTVGILSSLSLRGAGLFRLQ
jgi:hypothetical protein